MHMSKNIGLVDKVRNQSIFSQSSTVNAAQFCTEIEFGAFLRCSTCADKTKQSAQKKDEKAEKATDLKKGHVLRGHYNPDSACDIEVKVIFVNGRPIIFSIPPSPRATETSATFLELWVSTKHPGLGGGGSFLCPRIDGSGKDLGGHCSIIIPVWEEPTHPPEGIPTPLL